MEVLFITHKYPPIIGGMEKQSFELTTRMSKKHTVHLHAYKGEGSKLMWFLSLKKEIKRILQQHPTIDIIHVNDGLMAAATLWLKSYTKIPVVATYHGLDITFPASIFQKRIIPKMTKLDMGICVSTATANQCIQRGFEPNKIAVAANGVDHDLAEIKTDLSFQKAFEEKYNLKLADKKIMMTMGRAVKRKGFSWFLNQVMPKLDNDFIFIMAGPLSTKRSFGEKIIDLFPSSIKDKIHLLFGIPTDVNNIVKILSKNTFNNRVIHVGKVPFNDLMQYLSLADVFVMPNIEVDGDAEGFGLVALEASLRNNPVVASGIEGITEAVHDQGNGILLPSKNAEIWIEKLQEIFRDKQQLKEFGEQSKNYTLDHFGWDQMVEDYEEIFTQVIAK